MKSSMISGSEPTMRLEIKELVDRGGGGGLLQQFC